MPPRAVLFPRTAWVPVSLAFGWGGGLLHVHMYVCTHTCVLWEVMLLAIAPGHLLEVGDTGVKGDAISALVPELRQEPV